MPEFIAILPISPRLLQEQFVSFHRARSIKVLKPLVSAQLLISMKGPNGGYRLARPANEISILDVLEVVEGPIRGRAPSEAPTHPTSRRLEAICQQSAEQVRKHLAKIKITDLNGRK